MKIIAIASFVEDRIIDKRAGKIKTKPGGPAFWIKKTLNDLAVTFEIISTKKPGKVEILIDKNGEKGKIISTEKINFNKKLNADAFIISTLGDDFDLKNMKLLNGIIALDVQGYIRQNGTFPGQYDLENIDIIKATKKELKYIDKKFFKYQKQKMLIITDGESGFYIYKYGKKYLFKVKKIKCRNTIGAGDTFLTYFLVNFLTYKDIAKAAKFTQSMVERFLLFKN